MTKYNSFLTVFIISVIAMIVFIAVYVKAIFGLINVVHDLQGEEPNVLAILNIIFNPAVIISGIILGFSSLIYRIMGIVHVARNKTVTDGEKAFWIIGFILMGFVTAIVFLILAKGKNFVS